MRVPVAGTRACGDADRGRHAQPTGGGGSATTTESFPSNGDEYGPHPSRPIGLPDVLSVAAVVVDADGRIVFWTPQAEELFGYTADEALGKYAARLLVHAEHLQTVARLFAEVLETGRSWAGAFPIRHKDGGSRLAAAVSWSSAPCGCWTTSEMSTSWASRPTTPCSSASRPTWPCASG